MLRRREFCTASWICSIILAWKGLDVYVMLKKTDISRRAHNADESKSRGRHHKLSDENIDPMNKILQTWGLERITMTWTQLAAAVDALFVS